MSAFCALSNSAGAAFRSELVWKLSELHLEEYEGRFSIQLERLDEIALGEGRSGKRATKPRYNFGEPFYLY